MEHDRNKKIKRYLSGRLVKARDDSLVFHHIQNLENIDELLKDLIEVRSLGFRGVVITAIVGWAIDENYDPLNNFYDCNPRAIFEQAIWYVLGRFEIPCGKSDPLNVAKNTNTLDENWASGKRPEKAANAVVSFLRLLEKQRKSGNKEGYVELVDLFFNRLMKYSEKIRNTPTIVISNKKVTSNVFSQKYIKFLHQCPEGGAVPQFFIGVVLDTIFHGSSILVNGSKDSVYSTNTTAKKPADIWLSDTSGDLIFYEVTFKKVDQKRLEDWINALPIIPNFASIPVIFLCRIPKDIGELNLTEYNTFTLRNVTFNFIDIDEFIRTSFSLMSSEMIKNLNLKIETYISKYDRPMNTKKIWDNIMGK